jgi:DHA2 family multidrug resistance protein
MGNATSLFNLMRNIGGSVGIALTGTLLERSRQSHTNVLVRHITTYDTQSRIMLQKLQSAFIERGSDAATALNRSHAVLFGMAQRQAGILSFNDAFARLGLVFLLIAPLVLIMRRPQTGQRAAPATPE